MTVYLPNVTRMLGGPDGWQTPFIVQNVGDASADLDVAFYRFSDGMVVTRRQVSGLKPGTSFADVPNNDVDLPPDAQFAVVVQSYGAPVAAVVNQQRGSGVRSEALSYPGFSSGTKQVYLPYVAKSGPAYGLAEQQWLSRIIIQNLGVTAASITARFTGQNINRFNPTVATVTRTILPGRSQFIDPAVEPSFVEGLEYSAVVTSDQPIAIVVNSHNDASEVAAPMGFSYVGVRPGEEGPFGTQFLPYVARNAQGGWSSRLVLQNMQPDVIRACPRCPSQSNAFSLQFRRLGSSEVIDIGRVVPAVPLGADRSAPFTFDPRSDSRLVDGEYSVLIGGHFAVVSVTLSPSAAMGYAGIGGLAGRVHLPNVTRTLGGSDGWTTPAVVQSAGATSMTLTWRRFTDGAVAATQTFSNLAYGQGFRLDPRSVADLEDDHQYAVTVDAPGGVTAIVMELNFWGGDSAMIYPGFASGSGPSLAPPSVLGGSTGPKLAEAAAADTNLAVGGGVVVIATNQEVQLRDKTGLLTASTSLAAFLSPVLLGRESPVDPRILYDERSGRFFLATITGGDCSVVTCSSHFLLAVSKSSRPLGLGAADWYLYAFDAASGSATQTPFADFTRMTVTNKFVLLMATMHRPPGAAEVPGEQPEKIHLLDKSLLVSGTAPTRWTDLTLNHGQGWVFPATMHGDPGPIFLVADASEDGPDCSLRVWGIDTAGAAPTLRSLTVDALGDCYATSTYPIKPGFGNPNMTSPPVYRNGSLWVVETRSAKFGEPALIRWVEIDVRGWPTTAKIRSRGVIGGDGRDYYLPAVTVTRSNDVVFIFGRVSGDEYPSLYVSGRSASDPPNALGPSIAVRAGTSMTGALAGLTQTDSLGMGDYFAIAPDPEDGSTWAIGQYGAQGPIPGAWVTHVASAASSR